jgi:hypothetical protein
LSELKEAQMADETSEGSSFDLMRIVINLAGIVMAVGLVALVVATIINGG